LEDPIDFVLHYGDSDHLFFIPQAKNAEDAMRYFFCIEGYGQSRLFGALHPELCLIVPLRNYLQDREAFEQQVEQMRRELRARQDAADGL